MHVKLLRIVHLSRIWQHFSDVVYSFCVKRARSQNFETITGNKLAARDKCVLIVRCSKTPTIGILNAIGGTNLLIGTYLVPLLRYRIFLIFVFACVMPYVVNRYFQKARCTFSSAMSSKCCRILPLFYHHVHSPINWLPEHRISRCQEAPVREWEGRLCQRVYT